MCFVGKGVIGTLSGDDCSITSDPRAVGNTSAPQVIHKKMLIFHAFNTILSQQPQSRLIPSHIKEREKISIVIASAPWK